MKNPYYTFIICIGLLLSFVACKENKPNKTGGIPIEKTMADTTLSGLNFKDFTDTLDGIPIQLYVLRNKNGMEATFTNYGQRLVSLMVPDRNDKLSDVVLGFSTLAQYQKGNGNYFGSIIGRYGNRIGKGRFEIDGKTYTLALNNGENHLHGGVKGFESVPWHVTGQSGNSISFHRVSPDMEEGYPGNLDVSVTYNLTDANELKITYEATTDKKTPVNLTNHSYFNLKGAGTSDVNDHLLQINSDRFLAVDKGLIPTGEIVPVAGTPFDFRQAKSIGQDLDQDFEQLKVSNGYDHSFVINEGPQNEAGLVFAARLTEPVSGREMEVFTSEPAVQIYGGNFLDGSVSGKKGMAYPFRGSICLETQHYPDSPNREAFPNTILDPGEVYKSETVYKFSTAEPSDNSGG